MSLDIRTRYISKEDFKVYFGVDLDAELNDGDNPSNKADAFLKRIEDRIAIYLNANFYRNIDKEYPEFSDEQKQDYAKALLEQAHYVFRNGDIISDSFLDFEKGEIASSKLLLEKWLSPMSKSYLMKCGLLTRKIKGVRRMGGLIRF